VVWIRVGTQPVLKNLFMILSKKWQFSTFEDYHKNEHTQNKFYANARDLYPNVFVLSYIGILCDKKKNENEI